MQLLAGPAPPGEEQPQRLFCTFRLGEQLFGVDVREVKEVNTETCFTRIHHAPPQVLGYVNLRGQIYLVLDLRQLLGLTAAQVGSDSRLLIFKPSVGEAVAGLVDRIGDIVTLENSQIERWNPGQDSDGLPGDLIGGVAQLAEELLLVLTAGRFLQVIETAILEPRTK